MRRSINVQVTKHHSCSYVCGNSWSFTGSLWLLSHGEWTRRPGVGKVGGYEMVTKVEFQDRGSQVWSETLFPCTRPREGCVQCPGQMGDAAFGMEEAGFLKLFLRFPSSISSKSGLDVLVRARARVRDSAPGQSPGAGSSSSVCQGRLGLRPGLPRSQGRGGCEGTSSRCLPVPGKG